jgi:hypothetical protein
MMTMIIKKKDSVVKNAERKEIENCKNNQEEKTAPMLLLLQCALR